MRSLPNHEGWRSFLMALHNFRAKFRLLLPCVLVLPIWACASSSQSGPAECAAAGGHCVLGPGCTSDAGVVGPQDCNPDVNPGGAVCCLPLDAG